MTLKAVESTRTAVEAETPDAATAATAPTTNGSGPSTATSPSARPADDLLSLYTAYVHETEPPLIYHRWCCIWLIAACLQRKVQLQWTRHLTWYPNFYTVLVGESGLGKDTAMGIARWLAGSLDIPLAPISCTHQALRQEMLDQAQRAGGDHGAEYTHHSLSAQMGEFVGFTGKQDSEKLVALNALYDCADPFDERTVGRGKLVIHKTWLNLIGGATPDGLSTFLPADASGNGFMGRLVMVYADGRARVNSRADVTTRLEPELLRRLTLLMRMSGKFSVGADYAERYDDWYADNRRLDGGTGPLGVSVGYGSRKPSYIQKLAMISAASRGTMALTAADFDWALAAITEAETSRERLAEWFGAQKYAGLMQRMRSWFRGKCAEGKTVPESLVYRTFQRDADLGDLQKLLTALLLEETIQRVAGPRGVGYRWNPAVA